jgi:hypothetical protein
VAASCCRCAAARRWCALWPSVPAGCQRGRVRARCRRRHRPRTPRALRSEAQQHRGSAPLAALLAAASDAQHSSRSTAPRSPSVSRSSSSSGHSDRHMSRSVRLSEYSST